MIKFITHLVVFAVGAGAGVYWGVHNPTQAQKVSDFEQTQADQVKHLGKAANQTVNPPVVPAMP